MLGVVAVVIGQSWAWRFRCGRLQGHQCCVHGHNIWLLQHSRMQCHYHHGRNNSNTPRWGAALAARCSWGLVQVKRCLWGVAAAQLWRCTCLEAVSTSRPGGAAWWLPEYSRFCVRVANQQVELLPLSCCPVTNTIIYSTNR